MSQANVDVVLRLFENTNARDFEAVLDAHADDVVLTVQGSPWDPRGTSETVQGKPAVAEWFGDWFRTFDRDYRFEIEEVRDWGDRVYIVATHHARGRESGAPIVHRAGWIYTVRDGRVARCEAYADAEAPLEVEAARKEGRDG